MKIKLSWKLAAIFALFLTIGGLTYALISLFGVSTMAVDPGHYDGTRLMAERLKEIADSLSFSSVWERYPPTSGLVEYFSKIKHPPDVRSQILLEAKLAEDLLIAGKTDEAVEHYLRVRQRAEAIHSLFDKAFFRALKESLAIAYLRLGEQQNCIAHHSIDSCLLPIRGTGVHTRREGSRAAIREYSALLEEYPEDLTSRWLLNIAYMTLGEYPDQVPREWLIAPELFRSEYDIKRFVDVSSRLGVHEAGYAGGAIMEDFDGDGYLDIVVSSWWLRDQLRYYHNNADSTFSERTQEAGLLGITGGLNISHADYNNDGHPDILVLRGAWLGELGKHPNSLLRNNGDGTFEDVTVKAGLLSFHPTQAATWGDYNNDGWIDLFIGNESFTVRGLWNTWNAGLENLPRHYPRLKRHPCQLYRNNGDGTFTNVASEVGLDVVGFVKGASWGDYNNDGRLDLYMSLISETNLLFQNDGKDSSGRWGFTNVTERAGVKGPVFSFATWFWDYNNDGWPDIFVADVTPYQVMSPRKSAGYVAADYLGLPIGKNIQSLFKNNRDGSFTDVTRESRLDKVHYSMGSNFGDLDNDGYLDFYLGTGNPDYRTLVPNRMFRNERGRFFQDVTTSGGFGHLQKGHGIAFGDIDNDGDQDIYAVMGGVFPGDSFQRALFLNPGHDNHWITLRLEGTQSNRAAIGARIKVSVNTDDGSRDIYATVSTGGSFGSSSLQQEIGLGPAMSIRAIEITWPVTGKIQILEGVQMDQILRIREGDPVATPLKLKRLELSPNESGEIATGPHSS